MNRSIKDPRAHRFSYKENERCAIPRVQKMIIVENIIDDDGNISQIEREEIVDYGKILRKTPAYVDKIEYIQKYGTLNSDNVMVYDFARTSDISQKKLSEYVTQIVLKNREVKE